MSNKCNWVLFSYNGNETVARVILGASFTQLSLFIDSGGNMDDLSEWLFQDWNDVQFVQIPNDEMGLGNSGNLVYCSDITVRICDLERWIVDYSEYPEGKIVRAPTAAEGIAEMEREAEKEDPEHAHMDRFTGRNSF